MPLEETGFARVAGARDRGVVRARGFPAATQTAKKVGANRWNR
jgi:hypothetical protein